MEKLLSIIVPSYNMEKYLPNGLGSLVVGDAELLQSLDVIVVNDGSKDRTSEIAHGFEAKYPGVFRVLDKSNGNYGSCINAALPLAAGRFVKILDADDAYDTAAFERYLRALAAMPASTDVAFNDWAQVDESGHVTETTTYSFPTDAAFGVSDILSRECLVAMHAVAYRTALLREIGYRQSEGISYTDTEWIYLPVASAREIRYVPEKVYCYLLGRDGQTVSRTSVTRNAWMMDVILGSSEFLVENPSKGGVRNSEPCCSRYRSAEWSVLRILHSLSTARVDNVFDLCAYCIVSLGIADAVLNIPV